MMPASYRVWVEETTDTLKGDRVITVNGPTRVTISPDPKSQRTIGLVLGITGPVFMVLGFVVFLSNITVYCDSSDTSTSCGSDVDPTLGLLMMLGGAAITPIGWVMFGKSMRPNMEVYSEAPAYGALERLRPRVGVVRTPGGAGLGAAISF